MSNKVIKEARLNTSEKKKPSQQKLEQKTSIGGGSIGARAILIAIGLIVVLVSCVYVGIEMMASKIVLTVDDKKYSLSDAGYYIYQGESEGNQMAMMYAQYMGKDYWNEEMDDEGNTGADMTAEGIISNLTKDAILYQEAVSKGYEATDEDIKAANEETSKMMENFSRKQKLITGLSEKEINNAILKKTIGERYRKDVITSLKVDYDKATKNIKEKDYKQYDFQYYHVKTKNQDDNGNETDMSDAEKSKLKTQMEKIAKKAKSEDFTKLIGEEEKTIEFNQDGQLLAKDAKDENSGFDKKIDSTIMKMKKDEVSEVLEGEDGYYIIKLVDNTSKESYDNAIKEAKEKADNTAFEEEYSKNIEPNHTVSVNDEVWSGVKIGSYCA